MDAQRLPRARQESFVIQPIDDELLLFDGEETHLLNATAAAVWRLCDGQHSLPDLSQALALDEPTIYYALHLLERKQLLENGTPLQLTPISRREFLKRSAMAAAAVPLVRTIQLPEPAQAASCPLGPPCPVPLTAVPPTPAER